MENLPKPRKDGMCCVCEALSAETRDGRYCKKCLKKIVDGLNPISDTFGGRKGATHKPRTYVEGFQARNRP